MYIKSMTTGRKLPAKKLQISWIRKFFLLPYILIEYEGTNLEGPCTSIAWYRPSDIGSFNDNT